MKKGFISMTIVYSFLLIFVFTLLALLVLYTQKSRLVDSIVEEAKIQLYTKPSTEVVVEEFLYTGSYQTFETPITGYYFVEAYGAQGGEYAESLNKAGRGGYTSGYLYLTKGDKLYIYVGGEGNHELSRYNTGGYNGGGVSNNCSESNCNTSSNFAGGGATDIRFFGSSTPSSSNLQWNSTLGLNSRIMVSGGGGGAGSGTSYTITGGAGGTFKGGTGLSTSSSFGNSTYQPTGGGQTAGGKNTYIADSSVGQFGYATQTSASTAYGGGGGGGYYGGAPGLGTGGSGGSSFISGYAGVNAITSSSNRTHTNNTRHYSGKYFLNGVMKAGVNEGDGKARITYLGSSLARINTKLDNVRYIKDCSSGNTVNIAKHWVEIQAIKDGSNIAKNKTATSTGTVQTSYGAGTITAIVDGLIEDSGQYAGVSASGNRCVTIDLGASYDLDEIAIWHYYTGGRTYYDSITSVSSNNSTWTEVINETVPESLNGKRVSAYSEPLNGYVQDGLLVLYDGISNTGTSRSKTTTTWKDLSGNSNDATLNNFAMDSTSGWVSTGLKFDGTDDYAESSSSGTNFSTMCSSCTNKKFSYCALFDTGESLKKWEGVITNCVYNGPGGFNLQFGTERGIASFLRTAVGNAGYVSSSITPSALTTYDVCVTYDQTKSIIYVNGEQKGTNTRSIGAGESTIKLGIFYHTDTNNSHSNGTIYNVSFYNRVLDANEIQHNHLINSERYGIGG